MDKLAHLDDRRGGLASREDAVAHLVDSRVVADVRQVRGGLYDVVERGPRLSKNACEHCIDVLGLAGRVFASYDVPLGIDGELTGRVDGDSRPDIDAVAVGEGTGTQSELLLGDPSTRHALLLGAAHTIAPSKIGRASCRERV